MILMEDLAAAVREFFDEVGEFWQAFIDGSLYLLVEEILIFAFGLVFKVLGEAALFNIIWVVVELVDYGIIAEKSKTYKIGFIFGDLFLLASSGAVLLGIDSSIVGGMVGAFIIVALLLAYAIVFEEE